MLTCPMTSLFANLDGEVVKGGINEAGAPFARLHLD